MKIYNDAEYKASVEMAHVTLDGWDGKSYNGEGRNLRVYTNASFPGARFIRLPFNGSRCYHKIINEFHPKSGVQMVEFFDSFESICNSKTKNEMKAESITRLPAGTLFDEMNRCHETGNHRTAIIVFKASNWPGKNYSEECRSYRSSSNQWGWDYSKSGRCRIGDSLDGSDPGVRLDWMDWEVDYWYWEN